MKQNYLFKAILLLLCIVGGVSFTWADSYESVNTSNLSTYDKNAPIGFGAAVTGSEDENPVTVTTLDELTAALSGTDKKTIYVNGTITFTGRVQIGSVSNKTIYGLPGATLANTTHVAEEIDSSTSKPTSTAKNASGILTLSGCSNIIIRNLTFKGAGAYDIDGYDNLTLSNCTNIWIDHCDFQDGVDGNLDCNNASDNICVSWCRFRYLIDPWSGGSGGSNDHRFSNLWGGGDTATGDEGHLNTTFYACWWDEGCKQRMPRVRFGKVHILNCLYSSSAADPCYIGAGYRSNIYVEKSKFATSTSTKAWQNYATATGYTDYNIQLVGNEGASDDTSSSGSITQFVPSYDYTSMAASDVSSVVSNTTNGAGATLTYGEDEEESSEVLYSWEGGTSSATEVGGTATASDGTTDTSADDIKSSYIRLRGSNDFSTYVINIAFDNPIHAGDKIHVTAYRDKNQTGKTSGFKAKFENGSTTIGSSTGTEFVNINSAVSSSAEYSDTPNTCTFTVPDDADGSTTMTITRSHTGTNLFISKLEITTTANSSSSTSYPITAKWDFQNLAPATLADVNIQGTNEADVASDVDGVVMHVISNGGKLAYNTSGYAQFNENTTIQVPVLTTSDVVTVVSYPGQSNYTVGGENATGQNTFSHTATAGDVTQGYVEIIPTATAYIYSIQVVQNEPASSGCTPFSITWSMANGAESTAVADPAEDVLSTSWSYGSDIAIDGTATGTYFGKTFTRFTRVGESKLDNNRSQLDNSYVEFKFKPYPGLTFTPTTLSFDITKIGTGDPNIWVECIQGSTTTSIAANVTIRKNSEDTPSESQPFDLTTKSAITATGDEMAIRIYIGKLANSKQVGIANVVIAGTVSGEKAALETYTVTFANNDADAYGTVPASVEVNQYESTTMPVNQTLYKSGYTLTGWNDGTNTYAIGADYTPTASVTMHPVFTANTNTLSDLAIDKTVTWYFGKSNGAIDYSGSANANVQQVNIGGSAIDLGIKMAGGSNEGRNDEWLNNQQKNMMVPVVKGAIVKAKVYYTNDASFNGETITYNADIHGTQGNVVFSYTYTGDAPAEIAVNVGNQFLSYISVTYPGTGDAWANFQSFEMDLTNGSYITSSETSNTTIGFKKDGENIVRTTADDSDAIGTLTGKFHSNEHGLQNFSMSVAVPGYVKISAGTCAWGGDLTISSTNGFSKTINTNTGACFHQNKTDNKVVAYYNIDEGTTLTIAGGSYMPYIAVESVDAIPTAYTVNFYNGETLVQTKEVYDGTTLGTLPTAPSVADGKHFRGWYTATDYTGVKATQATVVTSNINYYAYVMDVNIVNGFILADNSGTNAENGQTLLNAIEYCSENASDNVQKIYVPNGTYDLGTACRTEVKKNIAILGESREGVLIQNHPTAPGIQATSVLRLTGDNVYLQNLTLRCDVSYEGSTTSGVGVALEINGDKSICNNVELQGNQDTYYSNGSNSQLGYFKGGRIEGTVDYICGGGNMWFEGTELYNNARTNADVILAPSTAAATTYGYVLNNCTIDAASNQAGRFNIARPWQNSPAATLINCTFKQNPSSAGYTNMTNGLVLRFHEYGSVDADGKPITGHTLTACSPAANSDAIYLDAVGNYTYATVLGAWDPEAIIALYSTSLTSNIGKWASFTPAFDCVLSDDNTKAYIITSINENSLTGETVSVLKAGEGYFINTPDASQTLKADITYKDADDVTGTMLVGCSADTPLTNDGNTKYFLGVKDNVAGLYYVGAAGITIPAGKCYLQSNSAQARSFMELIIDDDSTTGINAIGQSNNLQSDNWYDLQGRQIVKSSNRQMKKGLYIVNGKKVVIK